MTDKLVRVFTEAGVVTLLNPKHQPLSDWAVLIGMSDSDLRDFVIRTWVTK